MEIEALIPHVEALIFASDHPLPAMEMLELLNQSQGFLEDQVVLDQVTTALEAITEKYSSEFYSFEIKQSGGGYQFLTKPEYHSTVARLNGEKYLKKLSNASLETLSIIAYKQPVTKGDIESIRGVNSDYSVQKLLEKELIVIKGRKEDAPGKPLLYTTSKTFMDYFGLNSPEDLPKIKEILQEDLANPTAISENQEEKETDQTDDPELPVVDIHLAVSENGQLLINQEKQASGEAPEENPGAETDSKEIEDEQDQEQDMKENAPPENEPSATEHDEDDEPEEEDSEDNDDDDDDEPDEDSEDNDEKV